MTLYSSTFQTHWRAIAPFLTIKNEADYDAAIERLNALLNQVGDNHEHPLYSLLETIGIVIHDYEEQHYPIPVTTGADALAFLMEEHDLRQLDLPEIGSQGVVSEILNGKRELNVRQIKALSKRFSVSPAVFI